MQNLKAIPSFYVPGLQVHNGISLFTMWATHHCGWPCGVDDVSFLGKTKTAISCGIRVLSMWCREPDLNRYEHSCPEDFKSSASAYSAIPAFIVYRLAPRPPRFDSVFRRKSCNRSSLSFINRCILSSNDG